MTGWVPSTGLLEKKGKRAAGAIFGGMAIGARAQSVGVELYDLPRALDSRQMWPASMHRSGRRGAQAPVV